MVMTMMRIWQGGFPLHASSVTYVTYLMSMTQTTAPFRRPQTPHPTPCIMVNEHQAAQIDLTVITVKVLLYSIYPFCLEILHHPIMFDFHSTVFGHSTDDCEYDMVSNVHVV